MNAINSGFEEKRKNGDIYVRLEKLESGQGEMREQTEEIKNRLRDNEECTRNLNKDIIFIKDSQVATHKRISQINSDIKEEMKSGFSNIDSKVKDIKDTLNKFIEKSTEQLCDMNDWKSNLNGAIKVLLGIPAIIAVFFAIKKMLVYLDSFLRS